MAKKKQQKEIKGEEPKEVVQAEEEQDKDFSIVRAADGFLSVKINRKQEKKSE